ncbi:MAG: iron ABC transporter permease [Clostridia bacterium]|nr:iron ABC transporter permease [Clostridia bacterium]
MRRDARIPLAILCAALPLCCALSLLLGASAVTPGELLRAVLAGDFSSRAGVILLHIRLPRLLGALVTGVCLAAAGHILQSVLNNPLASPSIIGINSGAGLFALLAMVLLPQSSCAVPAAAFAGALITALAVYAVSVLAGASKSTLILSGVAISALLSALMDAIVTFCPDAAVSRSSFSIGGFESITLPRIAAVFPFAAAGLLIAVLFSMEMSILSMGDDAARGVGVRTALFRLLFLSAAALLSASAVSLSGLVGFVGLIAPHIARLLAPGDTRLRLPLCALCGALLCVVCDLAARLLFAPYELPVGILLSLLGVPFFLSLLFRQKRRNRHDCA